MNVFKVDNDQLLELEKEFNRTFFGRRILLFSGIPVLLSVYSFLIFLASILVPMFENIASNDVYYSNHTWIYCSFLLLNLSFLAIARLHYYKMLKEYIESKKSK